MQSPDLTPGAPLPDGVSGSGDLIPQPRLDPRVPCDFLPSRSSKQLSHFAPDNFFKAINSIANDLNRDAQNFFSVRNIGFVLT